MLREATTKNLPLPVGGRNRLRFFDPAGKLVGMFSNAGAAICADKNGNVFIPLDGTITEYAHGGIPLLRLSICQVAVQIGYPLTQ